MRVLLTGAPSRSSSGTATTSKPPRAPIARRRGTSPLRPRPSAKPSPTTSVCMPVRTGEVARHEDLGLERGQFAGEGDDLQLADAERGEALAPLGQRRERRAGVEGGAEDQVGVRVERDHHAAAAARPRERGGEDALVPEVHAVEDADADRGPGPGPAHGRPCRTAHGKTTRGQASAWPAARRAPGGPAGSSPPRASASPAGP